MSTGIIGGADGPTAIFVFGPSPAEIAGMAVAAVVVVVGLIVFFRNRRKK